jgi:hypothetical protein
MVRTAWDDVFLADWARGVRCDFKVAHPVPPVLGDEHSDPAATGVSASRVVRPVIRMARLCVPEEPIRIEGDPSLAPTGLPRPDGG